MESTQIKTYYFLLMGVTLTLFIFDAPQVVLNVFYSGLVFFTAYFIAIYIEQKIPDKIKSVIFGALLLLTLTTLFFSAVVVGIMLIDLVFAR